MPNEEAIMQAIFGGDTGETAPEVNDNNQQQQDPTPEAPEVEEQPKDTPEGDGEGEGNPQEPRLYAGKYKTPEEMEKAYLEAQKNFTLDRQEKADLRKQLAEIKEALAPKQEKKDTKEYREELLQRLYSDPENVIAEMADKIADKKMADKLGPIMPVIEQQLMNNQINNFMSTVPDAKDYSDDMALIIQANPDIVKDPNWLQTVYWQAKVTKLEAKLQGQQTKQKAEQLTTQKKIAQMPTGGKVPQEPKSKEDKMLENIFTSSGGGGIFG